MANIKQIKAREILDARGNPTIETKIILGNGLSAVASVPAGTSTGIHEAYELRDGDKKRYRGMGMLKAINNIHTKIFPKLNGVDITMQEKIDDLMIKLDGTKNKKKLGANSILSVSLACSRAGALAKNLELYKYISQTYKFPINKFKLPTPSFNIFNGGKHADTTLDFQEFMIMPLKKISFSEKLRMGSEIFHELSYVLKESNYDTDVGSEGGYAPDIVSSIQAIELIIAAIIRAGYAPGNDIGICIDVGSSELYDRSTGEYIFKLDQSSYRKSNLIGLYYEWFRKFPIISIEDGLAEDDWEGWRELTEELGKDMLLVGDDLFVTNIDRLRKGFKEKVANAILIKPNQVGTLTETIACVKLAQRHNYKTMVSHRSGETCDNYIADLAVAVGADFIKSGSLSRGERLSKYNRLMEIEAEL
ncbi:phosphopyruvate hydratase [Candidatus Falkowbacteria bacterium CG_4_9_14_3_um_filter_36_9]|uniref:Enolase n=1 Tax=Candidatus Falkowbacteria bacterium CG02_land_8_20_14_3_00_36_14 TaxID=1974560 RepID=A0A2M7DNJ0_9BACT|nr:MAG: phosphopyruvate hydratase [Candidatus Falkowbacteria bacterium CG02_land_8_20_14_3_00_36_14]PIX11933.1 MAG: phosphopyruvate hydratase [Candidatus Falkowbacteria bacterium CG_4_8_14_3_um_filter_36_11]PJA11169.1 MAG: phosphopyruvate hydratase [Candidatus Falkowbacteria bacterium CG_4_10_14_0_2_um_filter_36_22]PJB20835.1 MAG: phosphopyruvate hydratase [Candidatus Falkowbacteria bacterium CG_4_9_14_3_um_filter_36_9]